MWASPPFLRSHNKIGNCQNLGDNCTQQLAAVEEVRAEAKPSDDTAPIADPATPTEVIRVLESTDQAPAPAPTTVAEADEAPAEGKPFQQATDVVEEVNSGAVANVDAEVAAEPARETEVDKEEKTTPEQTPQETAESATEPAMQAGEETIKESDSEAVKEAM